MKYASHRKPYKRHVIDKKDNTSGPFGKRLVNQDASLGFSSAIYKTEDEKIETPMGVSQWMQHGEKHGYADYWREKERPTNYDVNLQTGTWKRVDSKDSEERQRMKLFRSNVLTAEQDWLYRAQKEAAFFQTLLYWSVGVNILLLGGLVWLWLTR